MLFKSLPSFLLAFYLVSFTLASPHDDSHYDSIASGVLFLGLNTADPNADHIAVFQDYKNHADAVASILLSCALQSSFDPQKYPQDTDIQRGTRPLLLEQRSPPPETFFQFLETVAAYPAFYHFEEENEDGQYELMLQGGEEQLLDEIMEKYENPSLHVAVRHQKDLGLDKANRIRQAFRELLPRCTVTADDATDFSWRTPGRDEQTTKWVLSLVVISKPEGTDDVTFDMAHVRLAASGCSGKSNDDDDGNGKGMNKVRIEKQVASMTRSSYSVIGRYISYYSGDIAKMVGKSTVDAFKRAMTTYPYPGPASVPSWLGNDIQQYQRRFQLRVFAL
ncbi:hypothetical protein EDD11_002961 [Mortierella claussenii]|nr:hypothetical protein EDD11_002961 [Mortierella claussenii]